MSSLRTCIYWAAMLLIVIKTGQILMWSMKYFFTKLDIDVLSISLEVCFIP